MKIQDLVGKTISSAQRMKRPEYDDEAWLKLTFTDGTSCFVVAGYGEYTGESEDEYPAYIGITEEVEAKDLIPVTD